MAEEIDDITGKTGYLLFEIYFGRKELLNCF